MNVSSVAAKAPSLQFVAQERKAVGNELPAEVIGSKWSLMTDKGQYKLNDNGKATANAYPIAIPEVGARPTDLANPAYQGKASPSIKLAQHDAVSRIARPLAAMLIGFFVGSGATLLAFRFGLVGTKSASEE